jgi:phosphohistidine phosphatase
LILFRHGKSDWNNEAVGDRARPLSRRGRNSARAMGTFLAFSGQLPDLAITSPATRATETLRLAIDAGGSSFPVEVREGLYGPTASVLDEIRQAGRGSDLLLAVGHEPTMSDIAAHLTRGRFGFPTAAMARIDITAPGWDDLEAGSGELAWLVNPRLLQGFDSATGR